MRRFTRLSVLALATLVLVLARCSLGSDSEPNRAVPRVGDIEAAIEAVGRQTGEEPRLFEVSATLTAVTVIVAEPAGSDAPPDSFVAMSWSYQRDELSGPVELGEGTGATFAPSDIAFNPDTVFDGIQKQLDSVKPVITDFAITGTTAAGVVTGLVYDATILSDKGGLIRVRVDGDGQVLEVMAE